MAQEITGPRFGHVLSPTDMIREVADQTGNGAFSVLGQGARWLFCRIYLKAFTSGTGADTPQFLLEGASDAGFTTDVVTAGMGQAARADEQCVFIQGFAPLTALKFWRVRPIFAGTDAGTYDAKLDAVS